MLSTYPNIFKVSAQSNGKAKFTQIKPFTLFGQEYKRGKFISGNKVMWDCLKTEFHAKKEKFAENDLVELV